MRRPSRWPGGAVGGKKGRFVTFSFVLQYLGWVPRYLSAPQSQRFLRFAIAMPIADPRNRAISETRESNAALRFKSAMESR